MPLYLSTRTEFGHTKPRSGDALHAIREAYGATLSSRGWLAVPHGFLPTQTAVESLTIGEGRDGNPRSRKGSPVNFDRCRMHQMTVLIIAPTRMEAVAALCPRGVEPGICAASILATSCGATVPRFSGCTGWDSETNALV